MNELEVLEQMAVDLAINMQWERAIEANKKILKLDKNSLGAQLRLGFIYLQNNKLKEAKKHYRAVLKIQSGNTLAQENLEKITILEGEKNKKPRAKEFNFDPNLFLEVPGKTRSVSLINPGQKTVLARLTIGQEAYLKPKNRKVEVRTNDNQYLGSLPDDLSKRLLLLMKAGSLYTAFIKDVSLSKINIFIKEEKKGKRVAKFSSFPKNSQDYIAQLGPQKPGGDDDHPDHPEEDVTIASDLDHLAEILTHEDKEYLPYRPAEEEDEENIEE